MVSGRFYFFFLLVKRISITSNPFCQVNAEIMEDFMVVLAELRVITDLESWPLNLNLKVEN